MEEKNKRKNYKRPEPANMLTHGRIPPQSVEDEQRVLGTILMNPELIYSHSSKINVDFFYKEAHQIIYSAIKELSTEGITADVIAVTRQLKIKQQLEIVGGAYYITKLPDFSNYTQEISHSISVIAECWIKREHIRACSEVIQIAYEDGSDCFEITEKITTTLSGITDAVENFKTSESFGSTVQVAIMNAEERIGSGGKLSGVPTGLRDLDAQTDGWQQTDLIIIGGRPAMGKTALMLHHILAAARAGFNPNVFSLEMAQIQLVNRYLIGESEVDAYKFKKGMLEPEDVAKLKRTGATLSNLDIFIYDRGGQSMDVIANRARVNKAKGQCGIVFIDYLGLISANAHGNKSYNRVQEVGAISKDCKNLAKELCVPVVLLSQLSRKVEERNDKRPMMSDLRESGDVEANADVVIFPYNHAYYTKSEEDIASRKMEYICAKHRNGSLFFFDFFHNGNMNKFYDNDYSNIQTYVPPQENFSGGNPF